MDALLLVGCGVLGRSLCRHHFPQEQTGLLLGISISVSLCLFSLSVIEFFPKQSLIWVKRYVSVSTAFDCIFFGILVHCLIILPSNFFLSLMEDVRGWLRLIPWSLVKQLTRSIESVCTCNFGSSRRCKTFLPSASSPRDTNGTPGQAIVRLFLGITLGIATSFISIPWVHSLVMVHYPQSIFDSLVSCLFAIGIFIAAILNGFGSVLLPYTLCLGWWIHPVHPNSIDHAEKALEQTNSVLRQRQVEVPLPSQPSQTSFVGLGQEINRKKGALRSEITFLKSLAQEQEEDLADMKSAVQISQRSQTTIIGRGSLYVGRVCSLILVNRLVVALWHISFGRSLAVDDNPVVDDEEDYVPARHNAIYNVLSFVLQGNEHISLDAATQYISLLIALSLSVSQARNFLRRAASVQRRLPSFAWWYYPSTLLRLAYRTTVSMAICCYSVASVILTKAILPGGVRLLPSLRSVQPYYVDLVYIFSALITGGILAVALGILRANTQRYQQRGDGDDGGLKRIDQTV